MRAVPLPEDGHLTRVSSSRYLTHRVRDGRPPVSIRLDEPGEAQYLLAVPLGEVGGFVCQRPDTWRLIQRSLKKMSGRILEERGQGLQFNRFHLTLAVLDGRDRDARDRCMLRYELLGES